MKVLLCVLVLLRIFLKDAGTAGCVETRILPGKDCSKNDISLTEIQFGSLPPIYLAKSQPASLKSTPIAGGSLSASTRNSAQSSSDVELNAHPNIEAELLVKSSNRFPEGKQDAQISSQGSTAREEDGNGQRSSNGIIPLKSTLRPQAEPFVPQTAALERATAGGSREKVPWEPFPVSDPTPRAFHNIDVEDDRYAVMIDLLHYTRDHLALFPKVISEFAMAKQVGIWFYRLAMAGKRQVVPWAAENPRKRSMERIACFERHMHSTFHTAPALDGNPEFATPFRNAYYFGRDALNSYIILSKNPELHLSTLRERLESLKDRSLKTVITTDQIHKLYFWPIIIAGAKQWYMEEAAIFHGYMNLLSPLPYKKYEGGTLVTDFAIDKKITLENLAQARRQEMKAFARILRHEGKYEKASRWVDLDRQMEIKGNYHSFNAEIEDTVFWKFQREINAFKNDKIPFSHAKLRSVANIWQVDRSNLDSLIWECMKSKSERGRYTMGPQSSEMSLRYFSNKLVELTRELVKLDNIEDESDENLKISKFLGDLYSEVNDTERSH